MPSAISDSIDMFRIFSILIGLLFLASACAAPEPILEERVEVEVSHPAEWFHPLVTSHSDSLTITGYSHAAATDEDQARQAGRETAVAHLRYEVDRIAEEARKRLSEQRDGSPYGEPRFILTLRNRVADLDLSRADLEQIEVRREDGVVEIFSRTVMNREEILGELAASFSGSRFREALIP